MKRSFLSKRRTIKRILRQENKIKLRKKHNSQNEKISRNIKKKLYEECKKKLATRGRRIKEENGINGKKRRRTK